MFVYSTAKYTIEVFLGGIVEGILVPFALRLSVAPKSSSLLYAPILPAVYGTGGGVSAWD